MHVDFDSCNGVIEYYGGIEYYVTFIMKRSGIKKKLEWYTYIKRTSKTIYGNNYISITT